MLSGLAKSLFLDIHKRSPWKGHFKYSQVPDWPLFEAFAKQKRISYLDYALTHKLLKNHPYLGQEAAFFICYLILAVKEGHVCIQVDGDLLRPDPKQLWDKSNAEKLAPSDYYLIHQFILEGIKQIPTELISSVNRDLKEDYPPTPLCRYHQFIYLQRYWVFESLFLKNLQRLASSHPQLSINQENILSSIKDSSEKGHLLEEQAQAILHASMHSLSVITGGPGTGKTYTAGYLLKIFWDNLTKDQKQTCKILLAAPTGKAAANLQKSLARVMEGTNQFPQLMAKTLHSLLGIKNFYKAEEKAPKLFADLILVDESSMIDIKVMCALFEAIQSGSRLVLLGDAHQLPSVEAGSIFSDLVNFQSYSRDIFIPSTELKVCLRAELRSLIEFAQLVKQGEAHQALATIQNHSHPGIKRFEFLNNKKNDDSAFLRHVSSLFPSSFNDDESPEKIINSFNQVRILSPIRKGKWGFDKINELMWNYYSQQEIKGRWLAIPIMITVNDYRNHLFNGETGVLMRKISLKGPLSSFVQSEDHALFPSKGGDGTIRRLSAVLLPKYEYAYCLSVHKSQGSEFDRVVLVMPEGTELFGREVFYTAITRARKQLDIYGSDQVIHQTILQKESRLSGINNSPNFVE